MPDPIIIGIAGFAKAGKSTFARCLVDALSKQHLGAEIVPFAAPLKAGLSAMGIDKAAKPDLYRRAAQFIGTDIVRRSDPDHWVSMFRDYVRTAPKPLSVAETASNGVKITYRDVIIADDVRFENEVAAVRDLGGIMVYVDAAQRLGLTRTNWRGQVKLRRRGIYRHESEDLAAKWWHDPFHYARRPNDRLSGEVVNANRPLDDNRIVSFKAEDIAARVARLRVIRRLKRGRS